MFADLILSMAEQLRDSAPLDELDDKEIEEMNRLVEKAEALMRKKEDEEGDQP